MAPNPCEVNFELPSEFPESFIIEYRSEFQGKGPKLSSEAERDISNYISTRVAQEYANWEKNLLNLFLKHMKVQEKNAPDRSQNLAVNHHPSSEILGASVNCNLRGMIKTLKELPEQNGVIAQKENIDGVPPIFSDDFNSDIEEGNVPQYRSPSRTPSNLSSPEKVQGSPILSKRKKANSKKSGSSLSNTSSTSVSSNNDSKVSASNLPSNDQVLQEMNGEPHLDKDPFKRESNKQPLKTIENTTTSTSLNDSNGKTTRNVLGVSRIKYGRSEIPDKGKRLRQTTLTLRKQTPIVDLGVMEVDETFDSRNEGTSLSEQHSQILLNNVPVEGSSQVLQKVSDSCQNEIHDTGTNLVSHCNFPENKGAHSNDVEIIETSPQQCVQSKLRSKLSLNLKAGVGKLRIKSPNHINSETKSNCTIPQPIKEIVRPPELDNRHQYNLAKNQQINVAGQGQIQEIEKRKSFETNKTLNDETFFSPAELAKNRDDISESDLEFIEFENEFKEAKTPPAKRKLMDSFDMIPGRSERVPGFAYREGPVRKKIDKANLPGQGCRECDRWWANVPEEERTKTKNLCSKHRARFRTDVNTPESFWDPEINYSYDSSVDDS